MVTTNTEMRNVKKTMEVVRKIVGVGAKKAMEEYLQRSGIGRDHQAF